ncbi:fibronectin type III domain-containing protein [Aquimarina algiphila]|uniref:fibronectin type III domain-containing protein n=1 Tax=Aquimarina algiphila TaxID=2047982 RepID=UPI00232F5213|nr:hypothetical protein [Aquimarina algiphila]
MKVLRIFILVCYVLPVVTLAQEEKAQQDAIRVLVRASEGKVRLRWAPTSPSAWLKLNRYGYQIERFTVKRNGVLLPPSQERKVVEQILPQPLAQWKDIVDQNDYAAVLAQSLYGETFDVEGMGQGGLAQIINKSKEIEQRFSFALMAADMNFKAATMGGLGYEDTTIEKNVEYLYRIKSLVPGDLLAIEMGLVAIQTTPIEPLPSPIELFAVPDDKSVLLTWEYAMFKTIFTSYYVERSENGTDFTRLGNTPLVNLNDTPEAPSKRMFYVDTLSQNNKTYYYRVKGISPFGEESPPSKVVVAKGVKKLSAVPHITTHEFDLTGGVTIAWEFAKEAEQEITGFELHWARQEKGPYKTVQTAIASDVRKTVYTQPEPSNYFKITAIGKNNQKTTSFPAFVQTIDSIPPAMPVGLTGTIDTLGIVQLEWEANTDSDILGYRVFRGHIAKEQVSQLTVSPIETTVFRDTVQIKSLNSKVFYQVVAVDKRFNMSEYSEKLALKKPDIVPPSSPVFKGYKVTQEGVFLEWISSSSDDIASHALYRQKTNAPEKGWQLLFQTDTITRYRDQNAAANTKYRYAIFAKDQSGLQSLPSTPISVTSKGVEQKNIKGFSALADLDHNQVALSWRKMPDDVSEILIYKSKKEGEPFLWRQLPPDVTTLEDTDVSPGNWYVYTIKVTSGSGSHPEVKSIEVYY